MFNKKVNELPLVKSLSNLFPNIDLGNTLIIGCQHLLPTTYQMFISLMKKGLQPKNIFLLGKCYSTDPEVYKKMFLDEFNVHHLSFKFDKDISYDILYKENVSQFFFEITNKINFDQYEKIIILDDGGYLIESFNSLPPVDLSKIIGIEQTSAGYRKLKNLNLNIPIINVARSKTKLIQESPLIADIFSKKLIARLKKYKKKPKKTLIFGYGPIGYSIHQALKNHIPNISYFDKSKKKTMFTKINLYQSLNDFDLIIGCTGNSIFFDKEFKKLKKGVILVSASSSDREFNAHLVRRKLNYSNHVTKVHSDIIDENLILLNNGFPLNFDEDYSFIDHEGFQLTRALLTSAIFQAFFNHKYKNKFRSLSKMLQKYIIDKNSKLYSNIQQERKTQNILLNISH